MVWSESGEKSTQIKYCLQVKAVQNSIIMDFGQNWRFKLQNVLKIDLFLTNMQILASQDINWWTGVVWITCGLLWCFYQLFGLSFWCLCLCNRSKPIKRQKKARSSHTETETAHAYSCLCFNGLKSVVLKLLCLKTRVHATDVVPRLGTSSLFCRVGSCSYSEPPASVSTLHAVIQMMKKYYRKQCILRHHEINDRA